MFNEFNFLVSLILLALSKSPPTPVSLLALQVPSGAWSRYVLRTLDHRATSDQVRASWVIAWKRYSSHYIYLHLVMGLKVVAIREKGYSFGATMKGSTRQLAHSTHSFQHYLHP